MYLNLFQVVNPLLKVKPTSELQKLRKNGFGLKVTTLNQVSILEVGVFLPVKRLLENSYLDIGKVKVNYKKFEFPTGSFKKLSLFAGNYFCLATSAGML